MKTSTERLLSGYAKRSASVRAAEQDVHAAIVLLADACRAGGKLLVCGNGGSCADADHIVGELVKSFRIRRPLDEATKTKLAGRLELADKLEAGLPAINLGAHASLVTALINDVGADYVYAQQVISYGRPGDVLLGISTSGNSKNVLYAAETAKAMGMKTVGLTGRTGGKMRETFDLLLCAEADATEDIQDIHSTFYHILCAALENEFWGE